MKKGKFKFFKKKWIYLALSLFALLISAVITSGKIKNLSWKTVFCSSGIAENNYSANLPEDYDMNVHFLNVGKADCIYINFKGHNILIDAADKEPNAVVTEYLKNNDVKTIDMAFISHPHRDHIGQMAQVIDEFEIKKFFEPEIPNSQIPTGVTYEKMLKALSKKNVEAKTIKAGENFEMAGLKVEVLGPVNHGNNLNNNSIVLKMTYSDVSFLFMGDAERLEEADILKAGYNVKADVLKVGHHGSKTSSSEKFLKSVSPKYAVISVGPDKSNLPKEEIIKRLGKYSEKIYRTDVKGNIIISTNGKSLKVQTGKD